MKKAKTLILDEATMTLNNAIAFIKYGTFKWKSFPENLIREGSLIQEIFGDILSVNAVAKFSKVAIKLTDRRNDQVLNLRKKILTQNYATCAFLY